MLPMQMHLQGFNGALTSGAPLTAHMQMQQQHQMHQMQPQAGRRVGGKGQAGAGAAQQYGYSGASSSPMSAAATGNGAGGAGRGDAQVDSDFALDLKRIGDDVETRTTIMVCVDLYRRANALEFACVLPLFSACFV